MRNWRVTKVCQGVIHMTKTCTHTYTKREVITSIRLNYLSMESFGCICCSSFLLCCCMPPTASTEGTLQPSLPLCTKHGSVQGTNPAMLPWCCYPTAVALERTSWQQLIQQAKPGNPGVSATERGRAAGLAGRWLVFYTTVQSTALVIKHYSSWQVIWGKGYISLSLILVPDAFFGRNVNLDKD